MPTIVRLKTPTHPVTSKSSHISATLQFGVSLFEVGTHQSKVVLQTLDSNFVSLGLEPLALHLVERQVSGLENSTDAFTKFMF